MRLTERLTAHHGTLLVVDMQEKLLAVMQEREPVIENIVRLVRGASTLEMPVWATEQYPPRLGPTVPPIAALIPERPTKMFFHCCSVPRLVEQLYGRHIRHVTVAGVEAHVCVSQTAIELLDLGFRVQVPADAVTSPQPVRLGVRPPQVGTRRGCRLLNRGRSFRMAGNGRSAGVQGHQLDGQGGKGCRLALKTALDS